MNGRNLGALNGLASVYFDFAVFRARTMVLYDVDRKQVFRNLLSEGASYDIAYFALKGAEMAIREW